MNDKQRKTMEAIFAAPVSPAIFWADIEGMLRGYGGIIKEGEGSVSGLLGEKGKIGSRVPPPSPAVNHR